MPLTSTYVFDSVFNSEHADIAADEKKWGGLVRKLGLKGEQGSIEGEAGGANACEKPWT